VRPLATRKDVVVAAGFVSWLTRAHLIDCQHMANSNGNIAAFRSGRAQNADFQPLRSLCRALDNPPPLASDCCVRLPPEIVKDPDPATYDAQRVLASGLAPSFNSPDITTVSIWPMRPNEQISAVVRNLSSEAAATRTRVDLSWSPFGIGLPRTPIASSFVDLARAGSFGSEQTLSWPTPPVVVAANRYAIFVDISHPYDRDPNNNSGQQTVEGMLTSAGRAQRFLVPVRNPLATPQTVNLTLSPAIPASWANVSPTVVTLAPGARQNVVVEIVVPASVPPSPAGTVVTETLELLAVAGGVLLGGVAFLILVDA
jgi:hypothetical protein